MNFPLKSDLKFVNNLKKGNTLYLVSAEWDANSGSFKVIPTAMTFDSYDTVKVNDADNTTIMANLTINGKTMEKHNLYYGFYASPLDALNNFKRFTELLLNQAMSAIDKENARQEKKN